MLCGCLEQAKEDFDALKYIWEVSGTNKFRIRMFLQEWCENYFETHDFSWNFQLHKEGAENFLVFKVRCLEHVHADEWVLVAVSFV